MMMYQIGSESILAAENGAGKVIGGSYQSQGKPASPTPPVQAQTTGSSNAISVGGGGGGSSSSSVGELHKATSQISITQLSGINVNIRYDHAYLDRVPYFSYFTKILLVLSCLFHRSICTIIPRLAADDFICILQSKPLVYTCRA